ncbi:CehA/McbA family metallohydrolase [Propylenella binzhouense]|uniref:Phosphotransferase n=1 Tax=Propylenella binzhouense TaxID=2555902 RepID=A0A964WTC2_9HYPH|nr:CehA/McbA family metallohydrolase [Propylenella binzhouense]MYZ47854.1 phosphotransferase [Propylenella binzhouense]
MTLRAFERGGRFFRGNVHTHSSSSDGVLPPEAVARIYADAGYDFLCLSDHFLPRYGFPITDTRACRTNRFTTILGAETHAPATSHGELWHILAVGLPRDFAPPAEQEDGVALAQRARKSGAFVGIAHPQWSGLTIEDGRALAGIAHAVEIYNFTCDIECARPDGAYLLDQLLNEGHRLNAYAADDAHFRWPDSGGGWIMVKAEENDPEALLSAMKDGAFYSSQGLRIDGMGLDGGELEVACSPATTVALVGRGTRAETAYGRQITRARLPVAKFAGDWLRVVVTDAAGRRAWSNPVWPE